MSEALPHNTVSVGEVRPNSVPVVPQDIIGYFEKMAAAEPEVYGGYDLCARHLYDGLTVATQEARIENEDFTFAVPLRPGVETAVDKNPELMDYDEHQQHEKERDITKLYQGHEQPALTALMLMAYKVTQAHEVLDTRTKDNPYGHVIIHGWNLNTHIYFVETYACDYSGDYMSWSIKSGFPDELAPEGEVTEPKPFITTTEKLELLGTMVDLEEIPTIEEPREVILWLDQRRDQGGGQQSPKAA